MVITDEMVEAAAKKVFLLDVDVDDDENRWEFYSTSTQNGYRRSARAVLEYAATLVPVVPEWPSHLGRAPTLGNIVRRLQTAEQRADILRCLSTIIECPEEDSPEDHARRIMERLARAPAAPTGPSVAERLVAYRCATMTGLLTRGSWGDGDVAVGIRVERVAHAMLAAEKEPT